MIKVPGIVSTQAAAILPATPHLTADSLLVIPTPIMDPVMVCVVLTGIPASELPISLS